MGRLPAGQFLLKQLNQLDLVISPRGEQRVKKLLQQCYVKICDLFNETVLEQDVDQYIKRCREIPTGQAKLIENELGEAARVKFLDRIGIIDSAFSKAIWNKDYSQILLELNRIKENLEELKMSDFWN